MNLKKLDNLLIKGFVATGLSYEVANTLIDNQMLDEGGILFPISAISYVAARSTYNVLKKNRDERYLSRSRL